MLRRPRWHRVATAELHCRDGLGGCHVEDPVWACGCYKCTRVPASPRNSSQWSSRFSLCSSNEIIHLLPDNPGSGLACQTDWAAQGHGPLPDRPGSWGTRSPPPRLLPLSNVLSRNCVFSTTRGEEPAAGLTSLSIHSPAADPAFAGPRPSDDLATIPQTHLKRAWELADARDGFQGPVLTTC